MRITSDDFETLVEAAYLAKHNDDFNLAEKLDILARKANAQITKRESQQRAAGLPSPARSFGWRDVPSVFADS